MAPIDKATLTNGDQFTNGTIGEGVLTIGICLCVMDMRAWGNSKTANQRAGKKGGKKPSNDRRRKSLA